jgi:hypothetical protein
MLVVETSEHLGYADALKTGHHRIREVHLMRRKQEFLQVRVDADEKKAFADAAELAGIVTSAWVRERLRQCAARELEAVSKPVAFLKNRKGTKE